MLHAPCLVPQGWQTALMYAANGGYTDVVRLLLERGADVKYASEV